MPRSLYPVDVNHRVDYRLPVGQPLANGERHTLFITELGNPDGFPAVFFHGGPGDGCSDKKAANFNPELYRIILIDQRGAGKSTPKASLEQNTTAELIEDMESVRQHLKIYKWLIVGSSWGTTLALLYAETYPEHVAGLVLRGIFLAREQDIGVSLQDNSQAAMTHTKAWEDFKAATSELLQLAHFDALPSYIETYYELLTQSPSIELKLMAASNLLSWSNYCLALNPIINDQPMTLTLEDVNKLILEFSYDVSKYYLSENQILQNIAVIRDTNIPVHIIQGTRDLICPPAQADALQQALSANLVTRVNVLAGHVSEPVMEEAMINATDSMALLLLNPPNPDKSIRNSK
jgi:proline iminopeptidase